jgi:hypothetical protein
MTAQNQHQQKAEAPAPKPPNPFRPKCLNLTPEAPVNIGYVGGVFVFRV